jgi:hypothetical protein
MVDKSRTQTYARAVTLSASGVVGVRLVGHGRFECFAW